MNRFLEEASRAIAFSSVSSQGNEELVNYLAFLLQNRGFKVDVQHVQHSREGISKRQFNLIGILGDPLVERKIKKGLLLLAHLDTPSSGLEKHWTETHGEPFRARVDEDRIWGLGAADAKLNFLAMLRAARKFADKKLKHPIYLVGTCGEEMGMIGCKYLIQSYALNPKWVLVGKPTDLTITHSHKGYVVYRVDIGYHVTERSARGFNRKILFKSIGRAAHSAFPEDGRDAIAEMIGFLRKTIDNGFEMKFTEIRGGGDPSQIGDEASAEFYLTSHQLEDFKRYFREVLSRSEDRDCFDYELGGIGDSGIRFLSEDLFDCLQDSLEAVQIIADELKSQQAEGFDLPHSNVHVSSVRQTPGKTSFFFNVRSLPNVQWKDLDQKIRMAFEKVFRCYPGMNISIESERPNAPLSVPIDHEWVQVCGEAMEAAHLTPNLSQLSLMSEAGEFMKKGFPALVFGPGQSRGNSHGPNESVQIKDLDRATLFYERLIEKVCL